MTQVTENSAFKALSVLIAVFIWYVAKQGAESIEISFYVPLVMTGVPDNMQVTSETPSLNVLATTTRRDSRELNPAEVQAYLNLRDVEPGTTSYSLSASNISAPEGVKIIRITPSEVELTVEAIIEKTLPIEANIVGKLKKGYVLKDVTTYPPKIDVRGPQSILKSLTRIKTNSLDLSGVSQSTDAIVSLNIPDPKIKLLTDIEFYTAHVYIESIPTKKVFENIPVFLRDPMYETRINPSSFNLHLEGPTDILEQMDSSQLYGMLDLEGYEPGNYQVYPTPILPSSEVKVLKQWPYISLWVKSKKLLDEEELTSEEEKKKP